MARPSRFGSLFELMKRAVGSGGAAMPLSDPLSESREFDDRLLKVVDQAVFGSERDALRAHGHARVTQSVRLAREGAGQLGYHTGLLGKLGILDRVDPLGKANDESIDLLRQFDDVFLSGSDGRLAFEHAEGCIGRLQLKLELGNTIY